jgi:hypothetical protein
VQCHPRFPGILNTFKSIDFLERAFRRALVVGYFRISAMSLVVSSSPYLFVLSFLNLSLSLVCSFYPSIRPALKEIQTYHLNKPSAWSS